MDPITITVSVLSIITLANNVYNSVSRLSKSATSNNRIKTQRISFKIEIVTLEQWLKNCAMSGTPLEGNTEVQELLQEFRKQAEKVEEILTRYSFGSDATESAAKKFTSRLRYESGGYEELNEMIVLLEKLNKALQTIAPPLPPGYDYAATSRNPTRSAAQRTSRRLSMPGEDESLADSMRPSLQSTASEMETQEVQQNIGSLWTACQAAFVTLSEFGQASHSILSDCRDRLKLWGCGLFCADDLHLDLLLGASKALNKKLAEPLAAHFVEIALEQLRVMDAILASESGRNMVSLKAASVQLKTVMLATDMTQPILEDLFYVSIMEQSHDDLPRETVTSRVKYLFNMVEMLFAYLPGINRLRLLRCHALERKESQQSAPSPFRVLYRETLGSEQGTGSETLVGATESTSSQRQIKSTADALIDANFAKIQDLEQLLGSRKSTDKTYAALLTKERQKLEDWRYDRDMKLVKMSGSELEIVKMQEQLRERLLPLLAKGTWISRKSRGYANVFGEDNPIGTAASSSDASARDEKRALMTEEQIKDAVKCFASANTHLYNATA